MLKIENTEVLGWMHAIRGMRNPMNSWDKSDSIVNDCDHMSCYDCIYHKYPSHDPCVATGGYCEIPMLGPNDYDLMKRLREAGTDHRKFMRMITVYVDITAPLYWWKEFDTYKVGTVANSCSTMHKIHSNMFTFDDFSCEHLINDGDADAKDILANTISGLNHFRKRYLETKDKKYWWQLIQLLPSSYNQKRTIMLNYEVLANIYKSRKNHKLDEWHEFCAWIEALPYSELITGEFKE